MPTTKPLAREELRFLLDEIGDVEVVGNRVEWPRSTRSDREARPRRWRFSIIQIACLDGLGVVRRLRDHQNRDRRTSSSRRRFDQFAVEAFKLEAMDYLLKPVDRERLAATLARARRAVADRITESVAAPSGKPVFTKLLVRSGSRNLVIGPRNLSTRPSRTE